MELHYKATTWIRVRGLDEQHLEMLKSELRNGEDPLDIVFKYDDEGLDFESMTDCEEYIPPEENGWQPTVEIREDAGDIIWTNAPEVIDIE